MVYKMQPVGQDESNLFYRMDGEAAERHGQIGYMRLDFGKNGQEFWTTWFDNQRHLKNYGFKENFNTVVDNLRGRGNIFEDRAAMRLFCGGVEGVSLGERGTGFKLNCDGYSYYLRCKPGRMGEQARFELRDGSTRNSAPTSPGQSDYDALLFAYDDRYLLPELAGQNDLPDTCCSVHPVSGKVIVLFKGADGCMQNSLLKGAKKCRKFADEANGRNGVTRAQEAAMLGGFMQGWNVPAAKPWNYDQDGTPRISARKKDEPER